MYYCLETFLFALVLTYASPLWVGHVVEPAVVALPLVLVGGGVVQTGRGGR